MSKAVILLALAGAATAASLTDIKHVVMLMLENRSFNHYFGTMSGVRGFADPNVLIHPNGRSVWYQNVSSLTTAAEYLLPYPLSYLGGEENRNKTQCLCAGANNWIPTHQAMNNGAFDMWAQIDTPQSWGYMMREDIPFHFALAEAFTVADTYHCGITSNTDPNRCYYQSGTIGVPGGPQPAGSGGVLLDDNQSNGCWGTDLDCLPYKWPAYAQYMDEAGVDWKCFQNSYNWATTNQLFYFQDFQNAPENSSLYQRGLVFDGDSGLEGFQARAANGTLPMVSYIFAPGAMQEHPPYTPRDGAYFINEVVGSVINGTGYNDTVVFITYDEAGGWGDSVPPIISPNGTAGEWFQDPYNTLGYTYSGPGPRVPLTIVSPFTRGGKVFSERADHSSILQFLEVFLTAHGYNNVTTEQLDEYRRDHMSDLINAFDFEHPDYSIPVLPQPQKPITNSQNQIIGLYAGFCSSKWTGACSGSQYVSGIPYGNQTEENSLLYEDGFKTVRGYMTEGRYLVFEANGYALSNPNDGQKQFQATPATADHSSINQRWVVHGLTAEGSTFNITSALTGQYISQHSSLSNSVTGAEVYNIAYIGSSQYTLQKENGAYLNIAADGSLSFDSTPVPYNVYSVTYHS